MNTDDLISRLSQDVPPVRRNAVGWRIAIGILLGALVSGGYVLLSMGIRPDLGEAMHGFAFWMKWGYTLSLSVAALVVTAQLARPDTRRLRWLWVIAIPVALLAGVGALELIRTPSGEWLAMWLGHSWRTCPGRVLTLAMFLAGALWAAAVTPAPAPPPDTVIYVVRRGDTLDRLSQSFLVPERRWRALLKLAGIRNPRRLPVGRPLTIPRDWLRYKVEPARLASYRGTVSLSMCR